MKNLEARKFRPAYDLEPFIDLGPAAPYLVRSTFTEMLDVIEKLLVLQDRDRKLRRVEGELAHIEPERQALKFKTAAAQAKLDNAKLRGKQLESDRKALELDVETKKQLIVKYANQQFQTRKNDEYRALAHEIDTCKADIFAIEDREIGLMEDAESTQKEVLAATAELDAARKIMDSQLQQLTAREASLKKEQEELLSNREQLAGAIDESTRSRYERLMRNKGESVIVGIQRGVCGGCHMRIPPQLLVSCQADKEIVSCSNCGRILYYTNDMDLAIVD